MSQFFEKLKAATLAGLDKIEMLHLASNGNELSTQVEYQLYDSDKDSAIIATRCGDEFALITITKVQSALLPKYAIKLDK